MCVKVIEKSETISVFYMVDFVLSVVLSSRVGVNFYRQLFNFENSLSRTFRLGPTMHRRRSISLCPRTSGLPRTLSFGDSSGNMVRGGCILVHSLFALGGLLFALSTLLFVFLL